MAFQIGVIGDLHTHWDEIDVAHFNSSDYDLLYFIGDLGGGTPESSLRIARMISRLDKPTLVMPGNNDTGEIDELAAELAHRTGVKRLAAIRQGATGAAHSVRLCGYSLHRVAQEDVDCTLISARPHSMGGSQLSFPELMDQVYDIPSMEASAGRLCELVDQVPSRDLVFFSHNGPTGLGDQPEDMWGCDFKPRGGDWGDPDLTAAIDHARATGRRVLAVIAGHMHLRTKAGGERPWLLERDGIVYVNTARVPRIFAHEGDEMRHHVSVGISADGIEVAEQLVGR